MKKITILGAALVTLSLVACKKSNPLPQQSATEARNSEVPEKIGMWMQIPFTEIGKGSLYGDGAEGICKSNLVIRNAKAWKQLKKRLNRVNQVTNDFTEQNIDFSQWTVLAVVDQVFPTGGYGIEISNVIMHMGNVSVSVGRVSPGDIAPMVITQPFHIVKIPKTTLPISFN